MVSCCPFPFCVSVRLCVVLRANLRLNGLEEHVHLSDFAASNLDGAEIDIRVPYEGTLGTARFAGFSFDQVESQNDARNYRVRATTVTVDSYLEQERYYGIAEHEHVALLKIDVEGYEMFVVEGARRVIRRYLPHIVMELQPQVTMQLQPAWDEFSGREITPQERIGMWFDFLRTELGYKVVFFPWESIKYGPAAHGYEWNGPLPPGARDFTNCPIPDLLAIKYTVNFWFIPPTVNI
jgi:FkbM family methyltransferase